MAREFDGNMKIEQAKHFDTTLLDVVNDLLPYLSSSAKKLNEQELKSIIASDAIELLVAVDAGRVCGILVLVAFRIPTGLRGWIEDVVVSEASRGKGVATMLLEAAIELARTKGVNTLDLTSRQARKAANHLYQKVGFTKRNTNVYRFNL